MKSSLCLAAILWSAASVAFGQQIEVSPKSKPHTQDATVGYILTAVEERFNARNPDHGGDRGFGSTKAGTLTGYRGKLVSWFGIVRELPAKKDGTFLIEHKEFDGLNDFHIQLASLFGGLARVFRMPVRNVCG